MHLLIDAVETLNKTILRAPKLVDLVMYALVELTQLRLNTFNLPQVQIARLLGAFHPSRELP